VKKPNISLLELSDFIFLSLNSVEAGKPKLIWKLCYESLGTRFLLVLTTAQIRMESTIMSTSKAVGQRNTQPLTLRKPLESARPYFCPGFNYMSYLAAKEVGK
jgi:hypothetical protein